MDGLGWSCHMQQRNRLLHGSLGWHHCSCHSGIREHKVTSSANRTRPFVYKSDLRWTQSEEGESRASWNILNHDGLHLLPYGHMRACRRIQTALDPWCWILNNCKAHTLDHAVKQAVVDILEDILDWQGKALVKQTSSKYTWRLYASICLSYTGGSKTCLIPFHFFVPSFM